MTEEKLDIANKLKEQIEKENNNVSVLRYALDYRKTHRPHNPIKRFMVRVFVKGDKTRLDLDGEGISFNKPIIADREFLEYAEAFFVKRRDKWIAELESL
ncbi:MAG: hypothetical protein IKR26_04470 [Lachnospiraceae bacterium]|nr:hypothetical protein [Lachnospiraceae bacterium]